MSTTQRWSHWIASEPQGVTFVELFFDLVFVYAVTQITGLLRDDLSLIGSGRAVLILWLVWWAWTQFTWTLNPTDTTNNAIRLITLGAVGAAFFMAQALPDAFGLGAPWFGSAYVIVRSLGLWIQWRTTTGTEYSSGAHAWVIWSSVGLATVVVGSLLSSPGRELAWLGVIAIDVFSASRAGQRRWEIDSSHFAERHGLILIIALGETLIATGVAVAGVDRDLVFAIGAVCAVALISAAWWIYFGSTMELCESALKATLPDIRGAKARDMYSLGHLPLVAGIISVAAAVEEVLAHPDVALDTGALLAFGAGTLLYVGGVAWVRHMADRRSMLPAGVVMALAIAVLVVTSAQPSLVTLAGVTAVLVAYAFVPNPPSVGH